MASSYLAAQWFDGERTRKGLARFEEEKEEMVAEVARRSGQTHASVREVMSTFEAVAQDADSLISLANLYLIGGTDAVEAEKKPGFWSKVGTFAVAVAEVAFARELTELRTIHDWVVKPELRKVPGVAEVNSWGGYEKQFHVVVAPEALLKYDLVLGDVFEALEKNNQNVGGGVLTSGGRSQLVHGLGRLASIEQPLRSLRVALPKRNPAARFRSQTKSHDRH